MSNAAKNLKAFGISDLTVDARVVVKGKYVSREAMITLEKPIKAADMALEYESIRQRVELAEGETARHDFLLYAGEEKLGCFSICTMTKKTAFYVDHEKVEIPDTLIDRVGVRVSGHELRRAQVAEGESLIALCERDRERNLGFSVEKAEGEQVEFSLEVIHEGQKIGVISNGRFEYEEAAEPRDTLGWFLATDTGQKKVFDNFDLDRAARELASIPVNHGPSEHVAGTVWMAKLKEIFEERSSCGDTYFAANPLLWRVVTRRYLGREYPGYDPAY